MPKTVQEYLNTGHKIVDTPYILSPKDSIMILETAEGAYTPIYTSEPNTHFGLFRKRADAYSEAKKMFKHHLKVEREKTDRFVRKIGIALFAVTGLAAFLYFLI